MGKAKLRKKIKGIEKQMKLHTDKIGEAFDRDDEGAKLVEQLRKMQQKKV